MRLQLRLSRNDDIHVDAGVTQLLERIITELSEAQNTCSETYFSESKPSFTVGVYSHS
jgi:hypothetical protein